MKNILFVLKFLKPYKIHLASLLVFLLLFNVLSVALPYLSFTLIIDKLLPTHDYKMILIVSGIIISSVIVMGLILFIQGYISSYLRSMIAFDMRNYLLRHLQTLSLKFYSNRNSGEILERLNTDVLGIQEILIGQSVTLISSLTKFLFLTIVIFSISWKLALPMFILILIQAAIISFVFIKLHGKIHELREGRSKLVGHIQERISLVKVIQVFVQQEFEKRTHHSKSVKLIKKALDIASSRSQMLALLFFIIEIIPMGVLWLGAYFMLIGELGLGTVMTMWAYSFEYIHPVESIIGVITNMQDSLIGLERVKKYLDETPEVLEIKNPIKNISIKGAIEFKSVDFSYESNKQILFGISLNINAGETVAFVGESGSGKSTITNLIYRFYDVNKGEIDLDGQPLKNYSLRYLRKNIGVVFQETDLFVASLRENILFGINRKVSDEEIDQAIKNALLDDVVKNLSDGLDTLIEEKGGNFSGGEKQRIAICRLILRKPGILIFDEATSALDTKSEVKIQEAMNHLMNGPTSIIIAHRLSTVIDADRIFVFRDGKIVENGKHHELLEKQGEYKLLWDEQLKSERENREKNNG